MDDAPSPDAVAEVKAQVKSINERRKPYGYVGELDNAVAKLIGNPEWHRFSEGDPEE